VLATVDGLGDLSHASVVFSRDARYAFVFGRDGGLTKVDLLQAKIVGRVCRRATRSAARSRTMAASSWRRTTRRAASRPSTPNTLELVADVPAITEDGTRSKVVGLADLSGKRFIYSLFEAGEIWITDFSDPRNPQTQRFAGGKQPYDALVTPNGRHYIAGLFGEDGLAMLDLWNLDKGSRKILAGYGKGEAAAAGVQDAAPARLVGRRGSCLSAGDRAP
jgi:protein NirF